MVSEAARRDYFASSHDSHPRSLVMWVKLSENSNVLFFVSISTNFSKTKIALIIQQEHNMAHYKRCDSRRLSECQ